MAPLFGQKPAEEMSQSQASGVPVSSEPSGVRQPPSTVPPPLPPMNPSVNGKSQSSSQIRKYLVLVHDVICIKFVPLVPHQSHQFPFAFKRNQGNGNDEDEDESMMTAPHRQRILSTKSETRNAFNHNGPATSSHQGNHANNGHPQDGFHHKSPIQTHLHQLQLQSAGPQRDFLGSSTAEVDHSLHALYLYKGFKEANVQCHWNAALSETFRNIQYKGYIVPSTILVGALPKFLSILRTAWSRQMLRSPGGYRIEFIGEIEEVIADPIQKGQFAPLSDSLCWAILELTSLGQEAFVDSIMSALQQAFPTMSCPSRELVFQTLEKLIRERKVYQTSRGYFVVTPDIFRYMVNANLRDFADNQMSQNMALDALLSPTSPETDKLSFSQKSWDSADHQNRCSSISTGEDMIELAPSSPKLKRHNSLKMIRQRDLAVTPMTSSTANRRYSLRLPKSKSVGRMDLDEEPAKPVKGKSSTIEHISRAMRSLRTATIVSSSDSGAESDKVKKNKSLFSKLFPFRRSSSKTRSEKIDAAAAVAASPPSAYPSGSSPNASMSSPPTKGKTSCENSENAKSSGAKFISTQTQTSNSTEQLCREQKSTAPSTSPGLENTEKSSPGRAVAVDSTSTSGNCADILTPYLNQNQDQNAVPGECSHHPRSSSRRSMSILDESPLYDVLHDVPNHVPANSHLHPNFQVGCPVQHPTFPGYRGETSRCSTLSSQISSLGYGSQGHPSLTSNYSPNHLDSGLASSSYGYYGGDGSIQSHSPCGTTSTGNGFPQPGKPNVYSSQRYKNSYEWYKRRYPNYISPMGRSSPLYSTLTAPRSRPRSRPTYESLLTVTPTENGKGSNGTAGLVQMSQKQNQQNTTTVTQAVKSTTDMELELLLPLGKIMKAALQAKKDAIRDAWLKDELGPKYAQYANKNENPTPLPEEDQPIKVNLDNTGAKLRVGEPKTKTEVTTVVNNNGVIETHFDSQNSNKQRPLSEIISPMHNTVEIKTSGGVTDVVLVSGLGHETTLLSTKGNDSKTFRGNGAGELGKGCNSMKDDGVKVC